VKRLPSAAIAVGLLLTGLLVGCTGESEKKPPPVSTVGVLKAKDLGPGDWAGPYADVIDSKARVRTTTCGPLGAIMTDSLLPSVEESLVNWANEEIVVKSFAQYYGESPGWQGKKIREFPMARDCVRDKPSPGMNPIYYFRFEQVGDVLVTHESNRSSQTDWILDTAMTTTNDAFVGVQVSYPVGTSNQPDVMKLLPAAIEASREFAEHSG